MVHAQRSKIVLLTPPAILVDNASLTVAELDTIGWDHAMIYLIMGATDIAMTALAVTESDTTGSGHANVTGLIYATSTNTDGDTSALPTATDDDTIFGFDINLTGRTRFLDLTATVADGSVGGYYVVIAVLSRGDESPQTAAEQGLNECLRV